MVIKVSIIEHIKYVNTLEHLPKNRWKICHLIVSQGINPAGGIGKLLGLVQCLQLIGQFLVFNRRRLVESCREPIGCSFVYLRRFAKKADQTRVHWPHQVTSGSGEHRWDTGEAQVGHGSYTRWHGTRDMPLGRGVIYPSHTHPWFIKMRYSQTLL